MGTFGTTAQDLAEAVADAEPAADLKPALKSLIAALRSATIASVIFFSLSRASRSSRPLDPDELEEFLLEPLDLADRDVVEGAGGAGVDAHDLIDGRERLVLGLLEQLDHPVAAVELGLGRLVEVGAELGEGFQLAERREVEPKAAGHLADGRRSGPCRPPARR